MFIRSLFGSDLNHIMSSPIQMLMNTNSRPSLINSVDFHPNSHLFCATFTHNNSVVIYQLDETNVATIFQVLKGPSTKLSYPQHALFSKDGRSLIVSNWVNQTFSVYRLGAKGVYQDLPTAIFPFLLPNDNFRPHGMAFSPDGKYLAVSFGASKKHPRAVGLYKIIDLATGAPRIKLLSFLQGDEIHMGIPKGITFSPDGTCLLVTLSETNKVSIYSIDREKECILCPPRQILVGNSTLISRPEDIKFTADGDYFAITNSSQNTITFYKYDINSNVILDESPSYIIENPEAQLLFPHGLAFSSDGKYLSITQFGSVVFDENDKLISFGKKRNESVTIHRMK